MYKHFISYIREHSGEVQVRKMFDTLCEYVSPNEVFYDIVRTDEGLITQQITDILLGGYCGK